MAAYTSPPSSASSPGNHFLTITEGLENLVPLGKATLWKGAQDILFEMVD